MSKIPKGGSLLIRDVWASNLEEEIAFIRSIVEDYPLLAMDTEFPGVVVKPWGNFSSKNYQTLMENVNMLKLIQLGLSFCDFEGNLPRCKTGEYCIWQFNFRDFRVQEDVCAADSIELLRSSGIDFKRNEEEGVDSVLFAELIMSSGVVLNDDIQWITFHSGYDFGYLLRLLTCQLLPPTEAEFFNLMRLYFPVFYDIKYMMKFADGLHGGLSRIAEILDVPRIGPCHQAGSDSLLTSEVWRRLKERHFGDSLAKFKGVLFGLGSDTESLPEPQY